MTNTKKPVVLIDDGEFYIEHNINNSLDTGNGFLLHRCASTLHTPGGYECVGMYEAIAGGKWRASIDAPYDAATDKDSRVVGIFADRAGAVEALWNHRHNALCRHESSKRAGESAVLQ